MNDVEQGNVYYISYGDPAIRVLETEIITDVSHIKRECESLTAILNHGVLNKNQELNQ